MAARGLLVYTLVLSNSEWSERSQVYKVNPNISYSARLDNDLTTLSKNSVNGGDTLQGFLYTPDLSPSSSCNTNAVPSNATKKANLPQKNFHLIAIAPWTSPKCGHEYLESASHDPVQAFLFYIPGVGEDRPPSISANAWGLDGKWTEGNMFPVYAMPPSKGADLMHETSLYSGNMTDVPSGHRLTEIFDDPRDYVRLHAQIGTKPNNSLPGLWVFLLIVLGALMGVILVSSFLMHWIQRRRRQALMRRVASGEVDLEALGIKRITVPQSRLDEFPLFIYPAQDDKAIELNNVKELSPSEAAADEKSPHADRIQIPVVTINSSNTETPIKLSTLTPNAKDLQRSQCSAAEHPSTNLPRQLLPFTQPTCPICLEDFVSSETRVRELPCRHIFHPECVDTFLKENSSLCPMCKANMLPKGYCPRNVTNTMVRRERALRRERERARLNGGTAGAADRHRSGETARASTPVSRVPRIFAPRRTIRANSEDETAEGGRLERAEGGQSWRDRVWRQRRGNQAVEAPSTEEARQGEEPWRERERVNYCD